MITVSFKKLKTLKKAEEINALYDSDPIKFQYGKAVLYKLEELIAVEIGKNDKISLVQNSNHIEVDELKNARLKMER